MTGESFFNTQNAESLAQSSKKDLIKLVLHQSLEGQRLIQEKRESATLLATKDQELEQKDKAYAELKGLYDELQKKHMILEGQHVLLKSTFFGKAKNKAPVAARD